MNISLGNHIRCDMFPITSTWLTDPSVKILEKFSWRIWENSTLFEALTFISSATWSNVDFWSYCQIKLLSFRQGFQVRRNYLLEDFTLLAYFHFLLPVILYLSITYCTVNEPAKLTASKFSGRAFLPFVLRAFPNLPTI